jgi:ferredoxin
VSLFSAAERFAALDHSAVVLNAERCLHKQDRFSDCEACFGICPVEAITPGKPPSLDAEKCQNCLACLTVCPVGAYAADDAVASLLNAVTHLEGNELELLCERNPDGSQGVSETSTGMRVKGCLAGLGCGAYLSLAAFGLEHILVRTDACPGCEWGSLSLQVEEQVKQATNLLGAWGKAEILACLSELDSPVERPLWEAKNPPLSRRDMFRMLAQQGKVTMARAMEDGQIANRGLGRNHLRIVGATAHLPVPQPDYQSGLVNMDFAWLSVAETCTACGVCARACPTHAIEFVLDEEANTFILNINPQLCIGCEMCKHVCEPEAVSVEHVPTFQQVFENGKSLLLQAGNISYCEKCKTPFASKPGVQFCSICEYRRLNPFGSKMPPGLKILPGRKNAEAAK